MSMRRENTEIAKGPKRVRRNNNRRQPVKAAAKPKPQQWVDHPIGLPKPCREGGIRFQKDVVPFIEGLIPYNLPNGARAHQAVQDSLGADDAVIIGDDLGTILIRGDVSIAGDLRIGRGTDLWVGGHVLVGGRIEGSHLDCAGAIMALAVSLESITCGESVMIADRARIAGNVEIEGTLTVAGTAVLLGDAGKVNVHGGVFIGQELRAASLRAKFYHVGGVIPTHMFLPPFKRRLRA